MHRSSTEKNNVTATLLTCGISFTIVVILTALMYAKMQIYPGGKYTLLSYDLAAQDLPMISSLRYIGEKDSSLMFSMFGGLGVDYWAIFSYYIASPINLLTTHIPLEYMPDVIYYIILLKLGLCAVSFCLFMIYGAKQVTYRPAVILLSVCYGLSSYNIFYSMTLKYLDGLILLPIILIGIEKIISTGKNLLFIISLTLSLYSNFYITYMTGLFICLYLLYRLVSLGKSRQERNRILLTFLLSSTISLGMAMPVILPTFRYISLGKFTEIINSDISIIRVTPYRIIRNLLPVGEFFLQNGGAPQIYCGTVVIIGAIIFFVSSNIAKREKIAASLILGFYFLSFLLTPLDRIWHGFMDPVCFPARYSYTCTCFLLIIACRSLTSDIVTTFFSKVCTLRTLLYSFLLVFVLSELYINGTTAIMEINNNSNFVLYSKYRNDISTVKSALSEVHDNGLYRLISNDPVSSIDGFLFGYNDVALFSSVYNALENDFLEKMGLYHNEHTIRTSGITPVMESLLGVKYTLDKASRSMILNPNSLPIGYLVNNSDGIFSLSADPFENQEKMLSIMLGKKIKLFDRNHYTICDISDDDHARSSDINALIEKTGPVWLFFPSASREEKELHDIDTSVSVYNSNNRRYEECRCIVNGLREYEMMDKKSSWCIYVGNFNEGDILSVRAYSTTYYKDPIIVTMDEREYTNAITELSKHSMDVTLHKDGIIEGKVKGFPDKKLLVSLPYLDGYRILVDGKRTSYDRYNPIMISVSIPEGVHRISISYTSPGLLAGIIIAISSLTALFAIMISGHKSWFL